MLGPTEFSGSFHQYNLLYGNNTLINGIRDNEHDFVIYNFRHQQPLNSDGLAFTLQLAKTETNPNFNALPHEIRIDINTPAVNETISGLLEYPIIRSRAYNLLADIRLDVNNSLTRLAHEDLFKERTRVLRAGLNFDFLDPEIFSNFSLNGISLIGFEFSQGLDALQPYLEADVATRPNTIKKFRKVTAIFSRTQPIIDNLVLRLFINGQYAYHELVSSEEYGFGGRNLGLAYDSYAISGDHGLAGKAELAYNLPIKAFTEPVGADGIFIDMFNLNLQFFGYYDSGKIWNKHAAASGQAEEDNAISYGGGIRGNIFKYVNYETYVAQPVHRLVDNEQNKKRRIFFNLGVNYS